MRAKARQAVSMGLALAGALALVISPVAILGQRRSDRVAVVATFSVLGDLVRNVAGDRADVSTLVGPNGDIHSFDPAPGDVRTLARA